ncbi:hypothetical protein MASR1M66_23350 [Aminivibrio sp.]
MLYKLQLHLEKAEKPVTPSNSACYSVDPAYTGDTLCYVPSTLEAMQNQAGMSGGAG